jgi:hypothetical protein
MKRSILLVLAAFCTGAALPAQSILDSIQTPDKAIATVHQTLAGTWLMELRRPGAPATQPPTLNLITFHPDGTAVASNADGTQATNHGVWIRVGDRKFLQTMFLFNFDVSRALTTVFKIRINAQLSSDGLTAKGTTELVIMDPTGKVMNTIPGGTYSGVRLSPEMPSDFNDFQNVQ